ncbi:MAG: hypothetical protein ACOH2H_14005 [Cypionkella sp.]
MRDLGATSMGSIAHPTYPHPTFGPKRRDMNADGAKLILEVGRMGNAAHAAPFPAEVSNV